MANCVMVQTRCTAMSVDSYNRVGVAEIDIPNGTPLVCNGLSTDPKQKHVFKVAKPTAVQGDVWMAYSPEVVMTGGIPSANGTVLGWRGLDSDPRDFTNVAGIPFDIFKPDAGQDIIQVSKDFFAANQDPDTIAGATYAEMQADGSMNAVAAATANYAGLQFKVLGKEPIVIGGGVLGSGIDDAWLLECTKN